MNRLNTEFRRLYLVPGPAAGGAALDAAEAEDSQGRVRAAVLELAQPADWDALATVWRGVQTDLGLPAPAIAVSGVDGVQLWFSFTQPLPAARVHAWLEDLCLRYLPEVVPRRLRLWPQSAGARPDAPLPLPAQHTAPGRWSAFVSADLAPVFADTPWLEMPPGDEGQARLLAGLHSADAAALQGLVEQSPPGPDAGDPEPLQAQALPTPAVPPVQPAQAARPTDPVAFLRSVMNDASAPLALRVEAAKALLPHVPPAAD